MIKPAIRPRDLPIGVALAGVLHHDRDMPDAERRFAMARDAGVFDYVETCPSPGMIDFFLRFSSRYAMPIRVGIFYYTLGRDEPLLEWHLRAAQAVGSRLLNIQIGSHDVDGALISDARIAETYLWAAEIGSRLGVAIAFEVHVNMWSENFARVERVAQLVQARGVEFNLTLDHSHVIFKIDNPAEQAIQGLDREIAAGQVQLDPRLPGDICSRWIDANRVCHFHARATVPNAPPNRLARHADGTPGRGIQYPFMAPAPGAWHAAWRENELAPWKMVVRRLLRHHATHDRSRLGQATMEFIPFPDYGGGAGYSIFDNNVACARWLRQLWHEVQAAAPGQHS